MKNGKKFFWGILFLLAAAAIIAGQLGYLKGFGFWSVLLSLGILGLLIDGIRKRSWGQILFSLAFLCIVNAGALGLERIAPWPVLGAAFLGTIGLNLLIPGKKSWLRHANAARISDNSGAEEYEISQEEGGSENVRCEVSFHSIVKYLHCPALRRASLECSFGSLSLYFSDVELFEGRAHADVDVSFGSMELYVPANWRVINNVSSSFGHSALDESPLKPDADAPVLTVSGDVSFSSLEIHRI